MFAKRLLLMCVSEHKLLYVCNLHLCSRKCKKSYLRTLPFRLYGCVWRIMDYTCVNWSSLQRPPPPTPTPHSLISFFSLCTCFSLETGFFIVCLMRRDYYKCSGFKHVHRSMKSQILLMMLILCTESLFHFIQSSLFGVEVILKDHIKIELLLSYFKN